MSAPKRQAERRWMRSRLRRLSFKIQEGHAWRCGAYVPMTAGETFLCVMRKRELEARLAGAGGEP